MRLCAALALAACGGAAQPRATSSTPVYLPMFERGRSWTFPIAITDGVVRGDDYATTRTQRSSITCSVGEVRHVGDANVARLDCAKPHDGLLVVGWWVSTAAGLYHPALPIDDPDELSLFGDIDLLLPARPTEYEHTEASDGVQHAVEAFRHGASWCARDTIASARDRRHYTLCVGDGGITGGGDLVVTDREWHRTSFGAVPVDAADPTQE